VSKNRAGHAFVTYYILSHLCGYSSHSVTFSTCSFSDQMLDLYSKDGTSYAMSYNNLNSPHGLKKSDNAFIDVVTMCKWMLRPWLFISHLPTLSIFILVMPLGKNYNMLLCLYNAIRSNQIYQKCVLFLLKKTCFKQINPTELIGQITT